MYIYTNIYFICFSPTIEEVKSWGESFDKLMKSNDILQIIYTNVGTFK